MGYTLTPNAIARVKPYLDEMVQMEDDIEWENADSQLSYLIRNGIAAAIRFNMPVYAQLKAKYLVRQRGTKTIAEIRNRLPSLMKAVSNLTLTIRDISDELSIVGAMIGNKERVEIYFPDALLDEEQLTALYKWSGDKYSIINHPDGDGVTLTKKDVDNIRWVPNAQTD